ncbi:MAG: radical SAM protein [Selenomonadaceae bacterium]|nr:radical SAM protein [Selenomonadaceae bacterium]
MLTDFSKFGIDIEDIYFSARLKPTAAITDFLEPYLSVRYLPHIEFRIVDQCNLNCKMCTEYCALVKENKFMDLEKFKKDFTQLHKFIDDFAAIRILGGEPLLNPEVGEYVKFCRSIYPDSPLHVVTNAILLPKMSDEFFDTVRENNAIIFISFYPPMASKMPNIKKLLDEKQVRYTIGGLITSFSKNQVIEPHNQPAEMFKRCGWARCHNLCDGKICACFKPFVTKYFNEYYGKNLPEDGTLDLYEDGLTTEKLKKFLLTPFERCRYCTDNKSYEWGTVTYPSPITDWVIE